MRVHTQSLRRLIEETVIRRYATRKRITLSPSEIQHVKQQSDALAHSDSTLSQLLTERRVSRRFLDELLTREALVRKVEGIVTRSRAEAGMSYHVREYSVPILVGAERAKAYNQALVLATDGRPIPVESEIHTRWVAPFRLSPTLRRALTGASPGTFVGPFQSGDTFLVVKLLAYRVHRYSGPARTALETRYFRSWIDREVRASKIQCYEDSGRTMACPGTIH
ncbi:MAG: hypothetical protein PVSMB7_28490 [Chloroflexota bacterium]